VDIRSDTRQQPMSMKTKLALRDPVRLAIGLASLIAVLSSILSIPVGIRFPAVFGYLLLVPGYAFARQLKLEEPLHILMLSLATSIGVASAGSVVALYAGWWSPNGILILIALITVGAAYGDLFIVRFGRAHSPHHPPSDDSEQLVGSE